MVARMFIYLVYHYMVTDWQRRRLVWFRHSSLSPEEEGRRPFKSKKMVANQEPSNDPDDCRSYMTAFTYTCRDTYTLWALQEDHWGCLGRLQRCLDKTLRLVKLQPYPVADYTNVSPHICKFQSHRHKHCIIEIMVRTRETTRKWQWMPTR